MHVFEIEGGGTDWVVATDVDDAWDIYVEVMGGTRATYERDEMVMEQLPDEKCLKLWQHPSGELAEHNGRAPPWSSARPPTGRASRAEVTWDRPSSRSGP
jgi:hypothetical protein